MDVHLKPVFSFKFMDLQIRIQLLFVCFKKQTTTGRLNVKKRRATVLTWNAGVGRRRRHSMMRSGALRASDHSAPFGRPGRWP